MREIIAIDNQLKAEIVGSYRRGKKLNLFLKTFLFCLIGATASSDIDVLVTQPTAAKLPSLLHTIVKILTKQVHFITCLLYTSVLNTSKIRK